ncbi:MAG TPA: amphi-Trp domain-containing protein [Candidatus Binatia bacterium]|nr:amphi-Trp domain-containing protein [Candidatus Binatia bacterium]
MAKDRFEFARIASHEEVADYLTSLAQGLKRGEVALESGGHLLRLVPGPDLKVSLRARSRERKGKIEIEVNWKRGLATRASELKVSVGTRPGPDGDGGDARR